MSKGSLVGLTIAAIMLGSGVYFVARYRDWNRRFENWLVEEPVRVRLDLAVAETYEVPFRQTCAIAHAQTVTLIPVSASDLKRVHAAAGSAAISCHISKPGDPTDLAVSSGAMMDHPEDGAQLERFIPVADGDYTFSAVVRIPVAGPSLPVDLVVRNELCGLEMMPGTMFGGIGALLLLAGSVAGVTMLAWAIWSYKAPTDAPNARNA